MHIGREEREIYVEPLTLPVPAAEPTDAPDAPDTTPVRVPASAPDEEEIHAPA
jgi:hypothetical protein